MGPSPSPRGPGRNNSIRSVDTDGSGRTKDQKCSRRTVPEPPCAGTVPSLPICKPGITQMPNLCLVRPTAPLLFSTESGLSPSKTLIFDILTRFFWFAVVAFFTHVPSPVRVPSHGFTWQASSSSRASAIPWRLEPQMLHSPDTGFPVFM